MCSPVPPPPLHLFEPTGFGGIFQHTCALASLLAEAGHGVTLHTSVQHEPVELPQATLCTCVSWPRDGRRLLRSSMIAARLATRTLPHVHRCVPRGVVIHVQGGVASGALTALTLAVASRRSRPVVYSPHNTFSRRGPLDGLVLGTCLLFAQSAVAYSQLDVATLRSRGARAELSPLIQLVPEPAPDRIARWRATWGAGPDDEVVLFAGVVRPDKRLDLLVRAARDWPHTRRLAIVGKDWGDLGRCRTLADRLGVELRVHDDFVPLEDFTAALAAADVVVAPYERASQSGVLSVASQLGTPTIASDVGGLSELAERTFPVGDVEALGAAIDAQLADGARAPRRPTDSHAALAAHESAYRSADTARSCVRPRTRRPNVAFVVWGPVEGRAKEFAAALGGAHRALFDFGIVNRWLVPLRYALSAVRTVTYLVWTRPRSLIVANPPIFAALIGWAYARVAGIPMVLDSHPISFGQKGNRIGRFFLPLHAALARRVATTIVGSEELARRVEAWGGRADIVHEAPPSDVLASVPAAPGDPPQVLWSGIFAADEPFEAVMEAAALMPEVELVVAGDLRRCPVDPCAAPANVRWLGFLAGDAFRDTLRRVDAVLALTDDSTSAMRAAAEAIYACKPLVMSDLDHLASIFPSGVRVRNEPEAIAAGVRAALADSAASAGRLTAARDAQLARWEEQRAMLLRRLGLAAQEPPPISAVSVHPEAREGPQ
jgi:glycosyltransferase involved in cell wall biosynthesis